MSEQLWAEFTEKYIPSPPDESLQHPKSGQIGSRFYWLNKDTNEVIEVDAVIKYWDKNSSERAFYDIYYDDVNGRKISLGSDDIRNLYDNKKDCRKQTHTEYYYWRVLRRRQRVCEISGRYDSEKVRN